MGGELKWRRSFFAALTLLLAASPAASDEAYPASPSSSACHVVVFEKAKFVVCTYRRATDELQLKWGDGSGVLGSLNALQRSLGADAGRVRFAMNAGMYDPRQKPVGLLVSGGRTLAPLNTGAGVGNFYLKPNGVFWISEDGRPHLDETGTFAEHALNVQSATQSGPLLVKSGQINPAFAPDGASQLIRNGVGVAADEAFFVISLQPVSFGRFARLMRDRLDTPNALYFDGTVSSLWWPEAKRIDHRTGLGPLIVVTTRPERR